jgi:hypothetical protein
MRWGRELGLGRFGPCGSIRRRSSPVGRAQSSLVMEGSGGKGLGFGVRAGAGFMGSFPGLEIQNKGLKGKDASLSRRVASQGAVSGWESLPCLWPWPGWISSLCTTQT